MSFFKEQKKKIQDIIKEPMLELVLLYLPHLQMTERGKEDMWELIAIKLYGMQEIHKQFKDTEVPIFNGNFIREIYEELYYKFGMKVRNTISLTNIDTDKLKLSFEEKCDRLLFELLMMRDYDIECLSKLSKEKYENGARQILTGKENYTDTLLSQEKEAQYKNKIKFYEELLEEKESQIQKLRNENKQLLDLNHDLLQKN